MEVSPVADASVLADQQVTITQPNFTDPSNPLPVFYGTQPPIISIPKNLALVNDSNVRAYGPAWFFQTQYNKLVIVPEAVLTPPASSGKRGHNQEMDMDFPLSRHGIAQTGDRPWYCYWNGTLLETFIYANASSGTGAAATTTTAPGSSPTTAAVSTPSGPPMFQPLTPYPKLVRVEERRVTGASGDDPNAVRPYCLKMQILNNGQASPIPDATTGALQYLYINETETDGGLLSRRAFENLFERDAQTCNCVWLST